MAGSLQVTKYGGGNNPENKKTKVYFLLVKLLTSALNLTSNSHAKIEGEVQH